MPLLLPAPYLRPLGTAGLVPRSWAEEASCGPLWLQEVWMQQVQSPRLQRGAVAGRWTQEWYPPACLALVAVMWPQSYHPGASQPGASHLGGLQSGVCRTSARALQAIPAPQHQQQVGGRR